MSIQAEHSTATQIRRFHSDLRSTTQSGLIYSLHSKLSFFKPSIAQQYNSVKSCLCAAPQPRHIPARLFNHVVTTHIVPKHIGQGVSDRISQGLSRHSNSCHSFQIASTSDRRGANQAGIETFLFFYTIFLTMDAGMILDGFILFAGALAVLILAVVAALAVTAVGGSITHMYKMFRSADKDMTVSTEGTVKVLEAEEGEKT